METNLTYISDLLPLKQNHHRYCITACTMIGEDMFKKSISDVHNYIGGGIVSVCVGGGGGAGGNVPKFHGFCMGPCQTVSF